MKKSLITLSLVTAFAASQAQANDLYLDLNPDTFHARVDATHATNGIIYSGAVLFTDDKGQMLTGGLWTQGQIGSNENLTGGLGGKIYAVSPDGDNYWALGLGGNIAFGFAEVPGLILRASVYYAPAITVSGDYDNLTDVNVEVGYELFENGELYGGIRQLQSDYENGDTYKFDNGLHAGIRITF